MRPFGFAASDSAYAAMAAVRRNAGRRAVSLLKCASAAASQSAPDRTPLRSAVHATDSARRGWTAKNSAASAGAQPSSPSRKTQTS